VSPNLDRSIRDRHTVCCSSGRHPQRAVQRVESLPLAEQVERAFRRPQAEDELADSAMEYLRLLVFSGVLFGDPFDVVGGVEAVQNLQRLQEPKGLHQQAGQR
jgi:hypothetical protein